MSAADAKTLARSAVRPLRRLDLSVARSYGIVVAFVVLFVTLSATSSVFLTKANLLNLAFQSVPIGILACGGALVFIGGGFDLSVGAIASFSAIIAAKAFVGGGVPVWPAFLLGALVGLGWGIFNGLLVTIGRVNAFIATLATNFIVYGLSVGITGGFLVEVSRKSWGTLGLGSVGGINYPTFVWLVFALFCGFLLSRTIFGRYTYAAGGNAEAARLSGVRVGVVRAATFAISGLAAGIAGVILASEVATAQPDMDNLNNTFNAITAVILGGVSILGGEGAIWRAVLGAFFLTMLGNGFNLLNIDPVYQAVFKGVILLAAVSLDAWARRDRT
jgi:ribose transport system permease protein